MTALELHRQNPSLDLAPILRAVKYMGFDSNALSADQIDRILQLYRHFEHDPELVVGTEAVCRLTDVDAERLVELLTGHRHEIPYLGTPAHPMVPTAAIDMIRALAHGTDPRAAAAEDLYTLTEMAAHTGISMASLSKYVKDQPDRIPWRTVGRMRKFPRAAIEVFRRIKAENLGRRGAGQDSAARQRAVTSRRHAARLAELEAQVEAAVEVSRQLSQVLNRLSRQVHRARSAAETGAKAPEGAPAGRARRTGGHRPDTIVAACKKVLAGADGAMRVADITERVIAMGTPIKAKNPNVTVSSILSSYDDFRRVRRGYYELVAGTRGAQEASPEVPAPSRQPAAMAARTGPDVDARDPEDILAGLQAAANSAEKAAARADEPASPPRRERRRKGGDDKSREDADGVIGLEPFGATG